MDTLEAMQNLGLSQKEAKVYLSLLDRGEASAYVIANRSGLKRPTVYVLLEELRRKGFVQKIPRAKKQLYRAEPPEEVFALASERLEVTRAALPKLRALQQGASKKVNVSYYEGLNGVEQGMEYKLKENAEKEIVGFYAHVEGIPEELIPYFKQYGETVKKYEIPIRAVVPEHPSLDEFRALDEEVGRKVQTVSASIYSPVVSIEAQGEIVRLADFKNLQVLVIENAEVAKTVRQIFEMVWKVK